MELEKRKEALVRLAEKAYTPAYVYFGSLLEKRLEALNKILEPHENFYFLYALLANNNPHLLYRILAKGGKRFRGFICTSPEELYLLMNLSNLEIRQGELVIDYHDPAMDDLDLYKLFFYFTVIRSYKFRVFITVNSLHQVRLVGEHLKRIPTASDYFTVLLRTRLDGKRKIEDQYFNYCGPYARFGVESLEEAVEILKDYGIKKVGLHIYPGTNLRDKDYYQEVIESLYGVYKELKKKIEVSVVDFGGGFGIDYEKEEGELLKETDEFLKSAVEIIRKKFKDEKIEKYLEPGRSIIAPVGCLLTRIKDLKEVEVENGERILFLTVDAGLSTFVRPYIYEQFHRVEILPVSGGGNSQKKSRKKVLIGGSSLASMDFLYGHFKLLEGNTARDFRGIRPVEPAELEVPEGLKVGDAVVIYYTGAYGYNMASHFAGRPRPWEILVTESGQAYVMREAEREEGLQIGINSVLKRLDLNPDR